MRRGAVSRFEALTRKTADLPVVVSWDRREADRRASSEPASSERRSKDRRKAPPFTWEAADFVVVGDAVDDGTAAPATKPVPAKAKVKRRKTAVAKRTAR